MVGAKEEEEAEGTNHVYFTNFYIVSLDVPLWISGIIPTGLGEKF